MFDIFRNKSKSPKEGDLWYSGGAIHTYVINGDCDGVMITCHQSIDPIKGTWTPDKKRAFTVGRKDFSNMTMGLTYAGNLK